MYGVEVIIRTTRFYEGYTAECEAGETDYIALELKFKDDLRAWLWRHGKRDGWQFEEIAEPLDEHWHAYDMAEAGQPVKLKFWFGDPAVAAMAKLTWDGV